MEQLLLVHCLETLKGLLMGCYLVALRGSHLVRSLGHLVVRKENCWAYDLDLKKVRELDALLGHLLEQGLVAPMEPAWDHSWALRA